MQINLLDLSIFLSTLPNESLEGSEIIKLYEQQLSRKSIISFIHTTLSTPIRPSFNKFIVERSELIETYLPQITLGRCQGNTQAIIEYITGSNYSRSLTLVTYDEDHKDDIEKRIKKTGKKTTCKIITARELNLVTDFSLYPQVIVDSPFTLGNITNKAIVEFVRNSKIVVVGS